MSEDYKMSENVDYKMLGENIRSARLDCRLTQEELAEAVSCNTSHISNIENNYTKVSLPTLVAISNALDTSVDYLIRDSYKDEKTGIESEILLEIERLDERERDILLRIAKVL